MALNEPEETENTFKGNARLEGQSSIQGFGFVALAEDSGLVVDALGGAPGIFSARWAGPKKDFSVAMQKIEKQIFQDGITRPTGPFHLFALTGLA